MINISDRLKMMADNIYKGETMADIGTDHGFLPLYLMENGICDRVVLADISEGSLDKAVKNVRRYSDMSAAGIDLSKFEFRLGDGISVLAAAEVDAVCIAGMGGILMTEILGADLEKAKSYKRLILQPRNAVDKLRFWLVSNGFEIEKNLLVREGKFICEIITAVPCGGERPAAVGSCSDPTYEFPEDLFLHSEELAAEYAKRKIRWDRDIIDAIGDCDADRVEEVRRHKAYFEELLEKRRNR